MLPIYFSNGRYKSQVYGEKQNLRFSFSYNIPSLYLPTWVLNRGAWGSSELSLPGTGSIRNPNIILHERSHMSYLSIYFNNLPFYGICRTVSTIHQNWAHRVYKIFQANLILIFSIYIKCYQLNLWNMYYMSSTRPWILGLEYNKNNKNYSVLDECSIRVDITINR